MQPRRRPYCIFPRSLYRMGTILTWDLRSIFDAGNFCRQLPTIRGPMAPEPGEWSSLCERTSLPRGDARISARATLPLYRSAQRKMPRLHQRSYCAARMRRAGRGCEHAMANGICCKGQGSLGAPKLPLGREWAGREPLRRRLRIDASGQKFTCRSARGTPVRSIDQGRAERHQPCRVGGSNCAR